MEFILLYSAPNYNDGRQVVEVQPNLDNDLGARKRVFIRGVIVYAENEEAARLAAKPYSGELLVGVIPADCYER